MRRLLCLLGNIPEDELLLSLHSSRKSVCSIYLKWLLIPSYRLPRWLSGKEPNCQCWRDRQYRFNPWVGKIPWSRKWDSTPVFLSTWTEEPGRLQSIKSQGVSHGLVTEHTHKHTQTHTHIASYTIFCYSEKGRKFLQKHILNFRGTSEIALSHHIGLQFRIPWTLLGFYFCFLIVLDESHPSTTRDSTYPMRLVSPSSAVLLNNTKFSVS